ncbi:hypothetical protein H311_03439, partial [Anncaliia algerae PRA109]
LNIKKLAKNASWRYKASSAIKCIRKFVQKQFKCKDEVLLAPDVNKRVFCNGMHNIPNKIRIRVERGPSNKDPLKNVFKVSLVNVNTFKGLITQAIAE